MRLNVHTHVFQQLEVAGEESESDNIITDRRLSSFGNIFSNLSLGDEKRFYV